MGPTSPYGPPAADQHAVAAGTAVLLVQGVADFVDHRGERPQDLLRGRGAGGCGVGVGGRQVTPVHDAW